MKKTLCVIFVFLCFVIGLFAEVDQWEYMVVGFDSPSFYSFGSKCGSYYADGFSQTAVFATTYENDLDILGRHGWELVDVVGIIGGDQEFILKRQYDAELSNLERSSEFHGERIENLGYINTDEEDDYFSTVYKELMNIEKPEAFVMGFRDDDNNYHWTVSILLPSDFLKENEKGQICYSKKDAEKVIDNYIQQIRRLNLNSEKAGTFVIMAIAKDKNQTLLVAERNLSLNNKRKFF